MCLSMCWTNTPCGVALVEAPVTFSGLSFQCSNMRYFCHTLAVPSSASAKVSMPSLARPCTDLRVTVRRWCAAATSTAPAPVGPHHSKCTSQQAGTTLEPHSRWASARHSRQAPHLSPTAGGQVHVTAGGHCGLGTGGDVERCGGVRIIKLLNRMLWTN